MAAREQERREAAEQARRRAEEERRRAEEERRQAGERWIAWVRADCAAYDSGRNEIAKSAVHQRNQQFIADTPITYLQGTLAYLSTSHGGERARIRVEADGFRFWQGVRRGHPVYSQIGQLAEGSCVVMAAEIEEANGWGEQAEVCDYDYDVRFTSIRACSQATE